MGGAWKKPAIIAMIITERDFDEVANCSIFLLPFVGIYVEAIGRVAGSAVEHYFAEFG